MFPDLKEIVTELVHGLAINKFESLRAIPYSQWIAVFGGDSGEENIVKDAMACIPPEIQNMRGQRISRTL